MSWALKDRVVHTRQFGSTPQSLGGGVVSVSWATSWSPAVAVDGEALTGWRPPLEQLSRGATVTIQVVGSVEERSSLGLYSQAPTGVFPRALLCPHLFSPLGGQGNIELSIVCTWFHSFPAYCHGAHCAQSPRALPFWSSRSCIGSLNKVTSLCRSHFNHPNSSWSNADGSSSMVSKVECKRIHLDIKEILKLQYIFQKKNLKCALLALTI